MGGLFCCHEVTALACELARTLPHRPALKNTVTSCFVAKSPSHLDLGLKKWSERRGCLRLRLTAAQRLAVGSSPHASVLRRTLDIHLGKVVLYQLSYARFLEDDADNFNFADAVNAFSNKLLSEV